MKEKKSHPTSDAEWYFAHPTAEERLWLKILFDTCREFGVSWSDATDEQKATIEATARMSFEKETAKQYGH